MSSASSFNYSNIADNYISVKVDVTSSISITVNIRSVTEKEKAYITEKFKSQPNKDVLFNRYAKEELGVVSKSELDYFTYLLQILGKNEEGNEFLSIIALYMKATKKILHLSLYDGRNGPALVTNLDTTNFSSHPLLQFCMEKFQSPEVYDQIPVFGPLVTLTNKTTPETLDVYPITSMFAQPFVTMAHELIHLLHYLYNCVEPKSTYFSNKEVNIDKNYINRSWPNLKYVDAKGRSIAEALCSNHEELLTVIGCEDVDELYTTFTEFNLTAAFGEPRRFIYQQASDRFFVSKRVVDIVCKRNLVYYSTRLVFPKMDKWKKMEETFYDEVNYKLYDLNNMKINIY